MNATLPADEHLWTEKAEKEHELFSELLWKELHMKDVHLEERVMRRALRLAAEMGEFYGFAVVPDWFYEPQKYLDGKRPINMLADDYEWSELSARVAVLRDGGYV